MTATARSAALWGAGTTAAVGITLAVASAPVTTVLAGTAFAVGAALVRLFGARMGLWCLFVATIPLREPLSVDLVGTTTLYLNDLLLLGLVIVCARENGLREIARRSPSFRIGAVLAALAVGGLYTATRAKWGITFALHESAQVAVLYVAWHWVRDARDARRTLMAVVLGLVPAVVLGLYQTTLPIEYFRRLVGTVPAVAWDEAGNPNVRIFSTFDHPLHFSHALSIGTGVGLGLVSGASRGGALVLLAVVAAVAHCNQYTYSLGGLVASASAVVVLVAVSRRRWLLLLAPLILVLAAAAAPRVFLLRIEHSLSGRNPSVAARVIAYDRSIQILRDHPLLGVGWGSMRTALEDDYRTSRSKTVAFTSENYFLERAVATGLVGLGSTLALMVLFLRNTLSRLRRTGRGAGWPRLALLAGGVAFYTQAQFIPAADPASRYVLWILLALAERANVAEPRSGVVPGPSGARLAEA